MSDRLDQIKIDFAHDLKRGIRGSSGPALELIDPLDVEWLIAHIEDLRMGDAAVDEANKNLASKVERLATELERESKATIALQGQERKNVRREGMERAAVIADKLDGAMGGHVAAAIRAEAKEPTNA